ncbi:asparaginase [Rothia sp. ZJ932]|uniref:asparaginase n=1 Tax=Rothia sp. ZJ932 TaxID=2810516 RepID=UPI0019674E0D|nr:asparaginase [Rothia sp. ZJ932]QRZ61937.1 asparaginase [Rothia sp. ZJ932]
MQTFTLENAAELAVIERSGFVESRHAGAVVVLDRDGAVLFSAGDIDSPIFARSALKPFQTIASMNAGAELQGAQIALASGSHTGSFEHMKVAQGILEEAGLSADALQNPAAWPQHEQSFHALVQAGHGKQKLAFNCSGKHAAFLWGCVKSGWSVEDYLSVDHPLQQLVAETIEHFVGEPIACTGIDGCGAPTAAISLTGLARGYSVLGASVENIKADARVATVATAMVDYPEFVQGEGQPVTALSEQLDAVVKNGAEGVLALGLRSGVAVAVKVLDGSSRVVALAAVRALVKAGELDGARAEEILGLVMRPITGGGQPVGLIRGGEAFTGGESS